MKWMLLCAAIALLGLGPAACGGSSGGSTSAISASSASSATPEDAVTPASSPAPAGGYLRGDNDGDLDTTGHLDDLRVREYGHPASTADRRAVTALVKRYYAAAAAGGGVTACALMISRIASEPDLGEAAEEIYPLAPGVPPLHGESCARIMSLLFDEDHRHLAADSATLYVILVRVDGIHGLALLGFRATPERQIAVEREGGVWKIDALLDQELP